MSVVKIGELARLAQKHGSPIDDRFRQHEQVAATRRLVDSYRQLHVDTSAVSDLVEQYRKLLKTTDTYGDLRDAQKIVQTMRANLGRDLSSELSALARVSAERIVQQSTLPLMPLATSMQSVLDSIRTTSTFGDAFRSALATGIGPAIEGRLAARIQQELVTTANAEAQTPSGIEMADAIAAAVVVALRDQKRPIGGPAVFAIVLSILIFLWQEYGSKIQGEKLDLMHQELRSIETTSQLNSQIYSILETRCAKRLAKMYAGPNTKFRVRGTLTLGTIIVVVERRGKWSRVIEVAQRSMTSPPAVGWVLNKYLE